MFINFRRAGEQIVQYEGPEIVRPFNWHLLEYDPVQLKLSWLLECGT